MENQNKAKANNKTTAKKVVNINASKVEKPNEEIKKDALAKVKIPVNISDLVAKYQKVNQMILKRTTLFESIGKLDAFSFSTDTLRDSLEIKDGEGNIFKTSNTDVIEIVTDTIKEEIFSKIKLVEREIAEASI